MTYPLAMHPRNRLRELRKKAGLSQAELAARTGVTQSAISQLENDNIELDLPWMRAFARELACTPADLLTEEDNPDRLTREERELVHKFRSAGDHQRELLQRVAEPIGGAALPTEAEQPRRRA